MRISTKLGCVAYSKNALISALAFVLVALAILAFAATSAQAETPGTGWEVEANTVPTNLAPGGEGLIDIRLYNVGGASSNGTVTVTDTLPEGLTATHSELVTVLGEMIHGGESAFVNGLWHCSIGGEGKLEDRVVTCTRSHLIPPGAALYLPEENNGGISHNEVGPERLGIQVKVAPGPARKETNLVTVTGGGAVSSAGASDPVVVNPSLPGFGFSGFNGWASNANGTVDTQAGSHPYELTINFNMNDYEHNPNNQRNLDVSVPPGLVGNPTAIPQCPRKLFDENNCPSKDQIGVDRPELNPQGESGSEQFGLSWLIPVYNLVPPKGMPAQFGFDLIGIQTFLDAGVRTGGDNGITERVNNLTKEYDVADNSITLWGIPGEASHNGERVIASEECLHSSGVYCEFGASSNTEAKPLLTLPSSCGAPPRFTIEANSWQHPETVAKDEFLMHENDSENTPVGFTGCEKLVHFGPQVSIAPDTSFSDTPAGLGVELRIPPDVNPEGLGSSGLKDTTVTLPEGVVINPGQATGLQACQPAQENIGGGEAKREEQEGPATCPAASKVGTDEIETPLLQEKLVGSVYVLQQNPPNLQLLVTASGEGVNLKLVGNVHLNEATGQLTTTFTETPDLPFTTFKLNFSGGAQAALATPVDCGVYSASALFVPWSSPFVQSFPTSSTFGVSRGPGGGACPSTPLPFAPSLIAGATTDQAGGFTNFSMLLQSGDGQQRIEKLQFKLPEGLAGMISSVPLCEEPQAVQGTCSAASQIGHSIVASGPGPYPLVVPQAGDPESPIYLTGPYQGAPFGLSIVTHVIAGPFNLGTVITRAKIEIDPHTAQVTVTTDPLPQIIAGVPTDLRTVDAVIDRPGFMFNPTNCEAKSFSGTAWGTPPPGAGGPGATAPLSSHFQMGSCRSLSFNPDFTVSTSGKTSRANGASLEAKIVYPPVPLGANQASGQANSAMVKVDLPKQLPSRLTTLQKACTAAQFNSNPAGCPVASLIGQVKVITPVLPVPLVGPVYFVSNGGEAFPNLIMVLQGDGVTVDLVGDTFISKAGITSSTFKTVPDVPFTSFDLKLPEGKYSALAANGNLCTSKLAMPTLFIGQNGAEIHESTPITVTGCKKTKALTRAQKLTAALKICHKKAKGKQAACVKTAHKQFGPIKKKAKKK
jgi:hypothetical protein